MPLPQTQAPQSLGQVEGSSLHSGSQNRLPHVHEATHDLVAGEHVSPWEAH